MSELLDSLRKATREKRPDPIRPTDGARSGAVISSIGLAPRRPRGITLPRRILAALVALGTMGLGSMAWPSRAADGPRETVMPADEQPISTAGTSVPVDPYERFRRATEFQQAGNFAEAIEIYEALLARDELPAQAHNNLALIHQQRGQLEDAVREFENALAHDPSYARAYNNLGVVLLAQHRPDDAVARFQAAAALDRRDPGPLVNLALAHKDAGRLDLARESLLVAIGISPHSAPAHYNLAVLYDRSGDGARAVQHYRAFLEHRGSDHTSLTADVTARIAALDRAR